MQTVPYSTVSDVQPSGLVATFVSQGHAAAKAPDGWRVDDAAAFQAFAASYSGSADELSFNRTAKLDALAALYVGKYAAGFNYTGPDNVKRTFQIDPTSQFNIDVQANAALGAIINSVALVTDDGSGLSAEVWDANSYFIAADNSHMPTPTARDMRTFALAVRSYVAGLILHNRVLKDRINAAADMATLNAIDITSGWPVNP